jgi:hypothetical protein
MQGYDFIQLPRRRRMTRIALVQTQGHSRDRRDGARSTPDYALLLNRLELLVSQGQDLEKAEGYLRRETVWKALPPDQALAWSRLAQSAGLPDLALEVLAWLNRTRPEVEEAWRNRRELLEMLGRRDEAAQVLAVGRLDGGTVGRWDSGTVGRSDSGTVGQLDGGTVERSDGLSDAPSHGLTDPFVRQRREDRAIGRYMEYFQGREECFARQWIDKQAGTQGYVPERRPLTSGDVQEHLQGRKTYGIYLLFQNLPEYNPALTDYKLSKVRGTPLECKRIHGLLNLTLDQCSFENVPSYPHPLLHVPDWEEGRGAVRAERIENLQAALKNLETTMAQVKRFL